MILFFIALTVCAISVVLFILKKEYIYATVVVIVFVVSIPITFKYTQMEDKTLVRVFVDSSPSMTPFSNKVEQILKILKPDIIYTFGIPSNRKNELKDLPSTGINIVVSDFLFDYSVLKQSRNTFLLPVSEIETIKTNHLVSDILVTNIIDTEYLFINLVKKSEVQIIDPKTFKMLFMYRDNTNYFIPTSMLPKEVMVKSLSKTFLVKISTTPDVQILWFQPNLDLRALSIKLSEYGYKTKYLVKLTKDQDITKNIEKSEKIIVGYPESISLDKIIDMTSKRSKIVILSPSEKFLSKVIKYTKKQGFVLQRAENKFLKIDGKVTLPVVYQYSYPMINFDNIEDILSGIMIKTELKGREILWILIENITEVDKNNIKMGTISDFWGTITEIILSFLTENTPNQKEKEEQDYLETAFEGVIIPEAENTVRLENLNKIREKFSSKLLVEKELNISSLWFLMIIVIGIILYKWMRKE